MNRKKIPILELPIPAGDLGLTVQELENDLRTGKAYVVEARRHGWDELAEAMEGLLRPIKGPIWYQRLSKAFDRHPDAMRALRQLEQDGLHRLVIFTLLRYYSDDSSYAWARAQAGCARAATDAKQMQTKISGLRKLIRGTKSNNSGFNRFASEVDQALEIFEQQLKDIYVPVFRKLSSKRFPNHKHLAIDQIVSAVEHVTGNARRYDQVSRLLEVAEWASSGFADPDPPYISGPSIRAKVEGLRQSHPEVHQLVVARLSNLPLRRRKRVAAKAHPKGRRR